VKTLGSAAKGIVGIINYSATLDTPENRQFMAAWQKKYPGTMPTNFEGETYVGMQVLFQAVKKAGSVAPADVARAMEATTFSTIYGNALMRKEDHQLVTPNYFGYVGEVDGVMKPIINMTVPADVVFPAPAGSCKLVG
jgi:branched-chain amino acid transport system substrate-binding protein